MVEAAAAYEAQHAIRINLHFGGTGTLLGNLLIHNHGDGFSSRGHRTSAQGCRP